ncbi:unnamed protein product [Calypogeia fissa]
MVVQRESMLQSQRSATGSVKGKTGGISDQVSEWVDKPSEKSSELGSLVTQQAQNVGESISETAKQAIEKGGVRDLHDTVQSPTSNDGDGNGDADATESRPVEVSGSVKERAAELVAGLRTPTNLSPNSRSEGLNISDLGNIQRHRAVEMVEDMRTPANLTSNSSDEGKDSDILDMSSIQRINSVGSENDPGERAARSFMASITEAQHALL